MRDMEELKMYIKNAQFEKCKGELRVLVMLFDFMPTYAPNGKYDSDSRGKEQNKEKLENMIEGFIKQMEEEFFE